VRYNRVMEAVRVPPFETFYEETRNHVFGLLVRRLGRQRAEDAFQETFLRALRAYPALDHGRYLKAWVSTIAERVAIDAHRRKTLWDGTEVPDVETVDERPSYEELRELTAGLPPKERAAVVLRYGYDLDYEQIGAAIGSSAEAARQATSSGVRRLRKKELS
jgi:RNA polymerase sigma factor (sigma-70 family)